MTSCPLAREDFLARAEPISLRVGGQRLQALQPRIFSTGSFGWCSFKVLHERVANRQLCVQLSVTAIVRGSKDAPTKSDKQSQRLLLAAPSAAKRSGLLARLCCRRSRPVAPLPSKLKRLSRVSVARRSVSKVRSRRWNWLVRFRSRQQVKPETIFFPDSSGRGLARLIVWIDSTQRELDLAMFAFTNDKLSDAVLRCHQRGVRVRIIVDDQQAKSVGGEGKRLAKAGIPVRHDAAPGSHMHHKFAVADSMAVLTGSFNWTVRASSTNREHAVILYDEELSGVFKSEFDKLWCEFHGNRFVQ